MHKPPAAADPPLPFEHGRPEIIAGVDLGSNSFHMIVGELRHGQLAIIDRIRETVRLAEGLSSNGDLSVAARKRALQCLVHLLAYDLFYFAQDAQAKRQPRIKATAQFLDQTGAQH